MTATRRVSNLVVLPLMLLGLVATMLSFAPSATAGKRVDRAYQVARNQAGDWYSYGAAGPDRFDCSGLIYYSFRKAGFKNVPRTSSQQSNFFKPIKKRNLRKGDLMFFHSYGHVYHVGIFVKWKNGRALMWDAPRSGERVGYTPAWTTSWFARTARRL